MRARSKPIPDSNPDRDLERLIESAHAITKSWAERHELWCDACFKDPLRHYKDEPGTGVPISLLCSDGPVMSSLLSDDDFAIELRNDLEAIGLYLDLENTSTAEFYLIDQRSVLQEEFDRYAQWRWMCMLIEADTAEVSQDLYEYFSTRPDALHRLSPRDFEKLISSVFSARGWKTEIGPGSGDGGVDLRVWHTDPIGDVLTLVQVKRAASHRPIGLEAVAALEAHVDREGANRGLFVTSSRFLPGVREFAARKAHRLMLASTSEIQQWCLQSAQAVRTAQNRVLALESFQRTVESLRSAPADPRLVVGGLSHPSFCVVVRESRTSALLVAIPSVLSHGDVFRGAKVPLLDGSRLENPLVPAVFRAFRNESDGRVSYWGRRTLYMRWDGRPVEFDSWD